MPSLHETSDSTRCDPAIPDAWVRDYSILCDMQSVNCVGARPGLSNAPVHLGGNPSAVTCSEGIARPVVSVAEPSPSGASI